MADDVWTLAQVKRFDQLLLSRGMPCTGYEGYPFVKNGM
jgi:hypothetical protein